MKEKKNSSSRVFVNLRNGVGFCLEGGNQAIGISWDKNILVANANLSSCDNEYNILPGVRMSCLESTQKTDRFCTVEEQDIFLSSRLML